MEVSAIDSTADFLNDARYGLCRELGFNIYRQIGNSREFVPLIVDEEDEEGEEDAV